MEDRFQRTRAIHGANSYDSFRPTPDFHLPCLEGPTQQVARWGKPSTSTTNTPAFNAVPLQRNQPRRKSRVNGNSLLPGTLMVAGGTFITPGVWPMEVKRVRRRLSASNELTGKLS